MTYNYHYAQGLKRALEIVESRAKYWQDQPVGIGANGKALLGPSLHEYEDQAIAAQLRNELKKLGESYD